MDYGASITTNINYENNINTEVMKYLEQAVQDKASDIFIVAGMSISFKKAGEINSLNSNRLTPAETQNLISELYILAGRALDVYHSAGDDDFSITVKGLARFRVNAFRQRGSMAAVIRVVCFDIPSASSLSIPKEVIKISENINGIVLVTGPAGSGRTTTLACIIDAINHSRKAHIITIEDPIEYLHRNDLSIVSQRELYLDTKCYARALHASLKQAPDVILLGEMRDFETICDAMSMAETGRLLISTLNTIGAVNSIKKIIDAYPTHQEHQIRAQLALLLNSIISQQLIPDINGQMIPVFEIVHINYKIRNLIHDGDIEEINDVVQNSTAEGMVRMDTYIATLFKARRITQETAYKFSTNREMISRLMNS